MARPRGRTRLSQVTPLADVADFEDDEEGGEGGVLGKWTGDRPLFGSGHVARRT